MNIRIIIAFLLTVTLSGCMGNIIPESEPTDRSYYRVDLKYYVMCLGNTRDCIDLTLIASDITYKGAIEKKYGKKISGPNYRGNLLKILLKPEGLYEVEKISENGRYYKAPVNEYTETVWRTMQKIEDHIYSGKSPLSN